MFVIDSTNCSRSGGSLSKLKWVRLNESNDREPLASSDVREHSERTIFFSISGQMQDTATTDVRAEARYRRKSFFKDSPRSAKG